MANKKNDKKEKKEPKSRIGVYKEEKKNTDASARLSLI